VPAETAERDPLDAKEQTARNDAAVAVARLELVLARQALRGDDFETAARHAQRALNVLGDASPQVDAVELELQAEGVLARAAREGVDIASVEREAAEDAERLLPGRLDDPKLTRRSRVAADIAAGYEGPATPAIDEGADARALRERAVRNQAPGDFGYRPAKEIVDRDRLQIREEERIAWQHALQDAYRDSEAEALVDALEARVIPRDLVTYPRDWPDVTARRAEYAGGLVARSPSWWDDEGREWWTGIYDIRDLTMTPAYHPAPLTHPVWANIALRDREALRTQSFIFRGDAADLAAGLPLLRYFGGFADVDLRPNFSYAEQQRIMRMIQAVTEKPDGGAVVVPLE
jgi:hypothetical protein